MSEIAFNTLKCYTENIKFLKDKEFETLSNEMTDWAEILMTYKGA